MNQATGVLLIYGALLMPAHGVYAASGNPQVAGDRGTVSGNTNGHASRQKTQRLPEKKVTLATQTAGLQDVAMRSPRREMEIRERPVQQAEEVAGSSSWFALLAAGLGVALISVFRRIGGLS